MNKSPLIKLNNGVELPALGLGVYLSQQDRTADAVQNAIESGYRLIDTAAVYGNEEQVGEGIAGGGIKREELFITTKLWISDYGHEAALRAFDISVGKLKLDYLDLCLLHWPSPSTWELTVQSYKAAKKLLDDDRVRAIGVCNFNANHLASGSSRRLGHQLAAHSLTTPMILGL
jgi:diketogulonate reductase-like aldo/keto reductase